MSLQREMDRRALRAAEEERKDLLERVEREARVLERHPEAEESRDPRIVDGVLVQMPAKPRLRGKLTVRW